MESWDFIRLPTATIPAIPGRRCPVSRGRAFHDTMANSPARSRLILSAALVGLLGLFSCVEGPSSPTSAKPTWSLTIAPVFSLAGPQATSGPLPSSQADALNEAFDKVDHFRMVVTSASTSKVVLDTVLVVTPGQNEYDLTVDIDASPGESYTVTLTALHGTTELFTSDPVTVTSTAPSDGTTAAPTPTNVTMRYAGPGAAATSISITPGSLVLAPAGSATLSAALEDQNGNPISGVTIAWNSGSNGVASVSGSGVVSGVAGGVTSVTATTPNGLQASAWVYVLGGTLAYVDGGVIKTRSPAGGTATSVGGSSASELSWSGDGQHLYYVSGGSVRLAGVGTAIVPGDWPALSPDGTKLAVSASGVVFANADGSNPTPGPSGSMPLWVDGGNLLVAGNGIQKVHADGSGRTTVVGGSATWPALGPDGRVAYVADGSLKVTGTDAALLTGAVGRPTWSPDGLWLIVRTSSGLTLVPADGSAPAVALPGLGSASSPAMKPTGSLAAPPTVTVTGIQPDNPIPGDVVTIVGSGFDWIIPANDQVIWPTTDGTAQGDIKSVTPTAIKVVMPVTVAAGQVHVLTHSGNALLTYQPSLGTVDVTAHTSSGKAVSDLSVVALDKNGTQAASGKTNASGELLLPGLVPGDYTLHLTSPKGFTLQGDSVRSVSLSASTLAVDVVLLPRVASVITTPASISVEAQGFASVKVTPLDIQGDTIKSITSATWTGSPSTLISVTGSGLSASISGLAPGSAPKAATLSVGIGDTTIAVPVTVTSFIHGTVTEDPTPGATSPSTAQPGTGITVQVLQAGKLTGSAVTDNQGRYDVHGLFAGTYQVTAVPPSSDLSPVPDTQTVVLDQTHTTGTADILMSRATVDSLRFSGLPDTLTAINASATLTVTPLDSVGNALSGRSATFASSATSVATVGATGKVTAVNDGVAWIRVTVESVTDSVKITVAQKAVSLIISRDSLSVTLPKPDSFRTFVGDTGTAAWTAKDANGYPITYKRPTFTSSDTLVAVFDSLGHATVVGAGHSWMKAQMDAAADSVEMFAFAVWDASVRGNVTENQLQLFSDSLYGKIINGDLVLDSTSLTNLNQLQNLQEVDGNVLIQVNPSLTDITGLSNLEGVMNSVIIADNPALVSTGNAAAPAMLQGVGGSLLILDDGGITNVDAFPHLQWIGGDLQISGDSSLTNLDGLDSLNYVSGSLLLADNPALNSTNNLPDLQGIGGDLVVDGGGAVVGLPALTAVPGQLSIVADTGVARTLRAVDLPSLQCTGYGVTISGNDSLTSVSMPALNSLQNSCGNGPPVAPPALARVSRARSRVAASEREARARTKAFIQRVRRAGEARLAAVAKRIARSRANAMKRRQAWLQTLEAKQPKQAGELRPRFPDPSLRPSFVRGGPSRVPTLTANFQAWSNPLLGTLDIGALTYVDGDFYLSGNGPLGDVALPNLGIVEGMLDVEFSTGLTSFTASALHDVNTGIWVSNDPNLTSFSVNNLHQVKNSIEFQYCDSLATFSASSLQYVGQTITDGLYFYANPALTSLSFPVLNNVAGPIDVEGSAALGVAARTSGPLRASALPGDALQSFSAPALTNVGNYFYLMGFPNLSTVQVATNSGVSLTTGDLEIYASQSLTSVSIPGLVNVNGGITFDSNIISGPVVLGSSNPLTLSGSLWLYGNNYGFSTAPSWSVSMPGLAQSTGIYVSNNVGLPSITLTGSQPASTGEVYFQNNVGLQTLALPSLQTATSLFIQGEPDVTKASFPKLQSVWDPSGPMHPDSINGGTLSLNNAPLTSVDFSSLTTIGGSLQINQTSLANLNMFSGLTSSVWDLDITNNPSLTDVTGLNALGDSASAPLVAGNLIIVGNTSLPKASATALVTLLNGKTSGAIAGTTTVGTNGG